MEIIFPGKGTFVPAPYTGYNSKVSMVFFACRILIHSQSIFDRAIAISVWQMELVNLTALLGWCKEARLNYQPQFWSSMNTE